MSDYYHNVMQAAVADFHEKLGHPINTVPQFSRPELRARLIVEEAMETAIGLLGREAAMTLINTERMKLMDKFTELSEQPNMVEAVDGIGDTLFVLFGAGVEMGIDLQGPFDEISRSNLAKVGGPVDAQGKSGKPPGWTPPDIAKVLREQGWEG